jgi:hypothetical protein
MGALFALLSAASIATATGLNAYLPLLAVGVFARMGLIQLNPPVDLLTHPLVLLIIAALAIIDFAGDKVPAVDSAFHAAGMVIHPIAGAIVFVAVNSDIGAVHPMVAALCGVVLAGGTHTLRAAARPIFTTATGGTANPLVSLAEDIVALVLALLALLVPVLAVVLAVALAIWVFRAMRQAARVWRRGAGGK